MRHPENFIATVVAGIGTWAITEADVVMAGKVITAIVGSITAIIFGIKTAYDMRKSRIEYLEAKGDAKR